MRYAPVAITLALSAGLAWAQPDTGSATPPTTTGEGSGSGSGSAAAEVAPPPPAPPVATPEPAKPAEPPPAPEPKVIVEDVKPVPKDHGFRFGSYGRVIAGTDLRGGKPEEVNLVAHGPRIVEPSYLELDLSYGFETDHGVKLRPVITLAFDGTLFHENGQFDAHPALRNMFLEAVMNPSWSVWVGSRMYRGDDIYLFDYWPLDDINTVGGGALYHRDGLEVAAHAGENRLDNPFTFQQIDVANPVQGATTVVQLNRQRLIGSASAAYTTTLTRSLGGNAKVHAEVHTLPDGTYKRDDGTFEKLPADSGTLVGAELSTFELDNARRGYRTHLNLFTRYATGLAAFDELAPPTTFGPDLKTSKASELTFGLSGNYDSQFGNMMVAALSRRFIDATGSTTDDPDNGWEYALDARPLGRFARDWFAGADVSYQAKFPDGLNRVTLKAEDPAIFQIAPMIVYSPMGPSAYDRPQLRAVFRAAHLNQGALDDYVPDDPRHAHSWVYFLGLQAEWWFNSSTYR
jgi:maltoporin